MPWCVHFEPLFIHLRSHNPYFLSHMSDHLHMIGQDEEIEKKRGGRVGPRPMWRNVRARPGVSASPHILPIFDMDMRVRDSHGVHG